MARQLTQYMGQPTDDEDELLSRLLASQGPQTPPMDAAPGPMRFRPPEMPGGEGGDASGFRPPPPANTPEPMQREGGRTPGLDDLLMLGAILGSAALNKPEISLQLAGAYGSGLMQDRERRASRNQQIDDYNAQMQAKDPELQRWKAEQEALGAYNSNRLQQGNLEARNRGLDLEGGRQAMLKQQYADANDINSAANQTEIAKAKALAEARSSADIATAEGRNASDLQTRRAMGAEGLLFAPKSAAAAADKPRTVKQQYEDERYGMLRSLLGDGKLDPATQKPPVAAPDDGGAEMDPSTGKPYTAAALAKKAQTDALMLPFEGTRVANDEAWRGKVLSPTIKDKLARDDASIAGALPAIDAMIKLRKRHGAETGIGRESADVVAQYNLQKGKVESAIGTLKTMGVLQPSDILRVEKMIPQIGWEGRDLIDKVNPFAAGDTKLGSLEGAEAAFRDMLAATRKSYGLEADSGGAKPEAPGALDVAATTGEQAQPGMTVEKAQSNATSGGQRLYTITTPSGQKGQKELTEAQANQLRAKGFTVQ